ncbi:phage portal protein [Saccharopolyspora sp. 6V]|uniref:phage portal protein n=1 Tax=Saccharopolyspora sp. 6V TaxID=2877239 RepID=UPI001CD71627|nr:phage portal protein [Saccharopolyspora sp. 6V]MCA1191624.1 phage portal protein [Saccharopolyspora sp. 6V]
MSQKAAVDLVRDELLPGYLHERERLDQIDLWHRWRQEPLTLPRKATPELRNLESISRTPWLNLVVTSTAQCMYVDGYRTSMDDDEESSPPWLTWNANDMDFRQIAIHRAALAYGYSYALVLPGDSASVIRGVSPRNSWVVYQEPAWDDWPMYGIRVHVNNDKTRLIRLYDEEAQYYLSADSTGDKVEFISWEVHGAGVCPLVRYTNQLDLEGRADGEVEPHIGAAKRINKTAYDRLLTQHFNSWKIRTVAGMAEPDTEEQANRKKMQLRQDDLLVAEDPDTKFGTLDETPLEGFISAWRADIEALAAVTQTPTHALTGQLVNLSAEALAAARSSLSQKVTERQKSFGRSHAQVLRLAAAYEGHEGYASDVMSRVTWQDMEIRSLSQAVDALGKAATMLGVPQEALWQRIPGVEKSDVDEWRKLAEQADPVARYRTELERQMGSDDLPEVP